MKEQPILHKGREGEECNWVQMCYQLRNIYKIPLSSPQCLALHVWNGVQGLIQDFRFGGETQHLGKSGGMFPQE